MTDRILRATDVCELLGGIAISTLYSWVKQGKLPRAQKIVEGGRASGWPESVIQAMLTKHNNATLGR